MKSLLRSLLVILVVAGLLLGGGVSWLVRRTLPQTRGNLAVSGLAAPVEVIRDSWGVPHIYAENLDDLFFAQGYVLAQDRLWQMEFNRLVAAGRLSEFGGKSVLKDDILLRSLGLYRMAQASVQRLSSEDRRILDAFARGVNAFAGTHSSAMPLEFTVLNTIGGADLQWEPWTATDSVAVGNVVAMGLSMNMRIEIFRAQMTAKLGTERAAQLEPGYPHEGPFIVKGFEKGSLPGTAAPVATRFPEETEGLLDDLGEAYDRVLAIALTGRLPGDEDETLPTTGIGSNNWVVAGKRTETGKPLLANDPHLGIQNPSIWYENHLESPGLRISGVTFAGVPGVVLGHNDRIAWGATNAEVDVQDLYVERINPANPRQYEYRGQWEDGLVWHEEFRVKGQPQPVVRDILVTRHGPVITEGVSDRISDQVALQWSLHDPSASLLPGVVRLWTARNWQDFQAAMQLWSVPSQNIVFADVDGNIGYQCPGLLPLRSRGEGSVPVPGWTGEYEWTGWIPYEDLPSEYNPPNGYIASANNRIISYLYAYYLSNEWAPPYRATRIEELLTAKPKLSMQDMRDILADVYSIPDRELSTYVQALHAENDKQRQALDLIKGWDSDTAMDSVPASLMETILAYTLRNTFGDELGRLVNDYADNGVPTLLRILPDNNNAWFDDVTTPGRESRDDILRRSLNQTLVDLSKRLGGNMNGWTWGKLHTATFKHQALGDVPFASRIFNLGPVAVPGAGGNGFTVYAATYNLAKPYSTNSISSMRAVYDLANLDRSLMVNAVGQSGQPGSKHYGDMIADWRNVTLLPMPFSRAAVEQYGTDVLTLNPR